MMQEYYRNCPMCNQQITHTGPNAKWNSTYATKKGRVCGSCKNKIRNYMPRSVESKLNSKLALLNTDPAILELRSQHQSAIMKRRHLDGYYTEQTFKKISNSILAAYELGVYNSKLTMPEKNMMQILTEMGITYKYQCKFDKFIYDFYLLDYDIYIEVDGDYWHANPIKYMDKLNDVQKKNINNDILKNNIMNKHNKTLLRFWESDINNNKQSVINTLNNTILHD
jgi:very-short-patch-repair endonuclease